MKNISILFLLIFLNCKGHANGNLRSAYFYGHITSNLDTIDLNYTFIADYILGAPNEITSWQHVIVDKSGKFGFSLPPFGRPGRIYIMDNFSTNILCLETEQIVEPGDKVYLEARVFDQAGSMDGLTCDFTGRGSAKYNCVQELKKIGIGKVSRIKEYDRIVDVSDSILRKKISVLKRYRPALNPKIYDIMMADIVGSVYENEITLFFGSSAKDILKTKLSDKMLIQKRKAIRLFDKQRIEINPRGNAIIFSPAYTQYLYERTKCELFFDMDTVGFKDFYLKLYNSFRGAVREKLVSFFLLNGSERFNLFDIVNEEDFTSCLKNAVDILHIQWLKGPMKKYLNARGKGAVAYDFTLPADSTEKLITLSQFKGKVVLVDLWGYQCTGCYMFSKAFHDKVYPVFENDSNFVVISIMCDESSRSAYMRRLRRENNTTYTFAEYVNLFGGQNIREGENMRSHYNIDVVPFIFLVGKNGKIFSTTLPYFGQEPSPNVGNLIDVINRALRES